MATVSSPLGVIIFVLLALSGLSGADESNHKVSIITLTLYTA